MKYRWKPFSETINFLVSKRYPNNQVSDTCSDEYLVPFYFLWLSVFNSLKAELFLSIIIDWNGLFLHTASWTFFLFLLCDCLCFNSTKAILVNFCFPPVMFLHIPSRTIFVLLYFLWLSVLIVSKQASHLNLLLSCGDLF